jgi:SNF2 family DNA or RNA helicase
MEIDFADGLFIARCTFGERLAFANGGWRWDGDRKRWVTGEAEKAKPFAPFATDAATRALGQAQEAEMGALALSHAMSYPLAVPAPPGLVYDPHQLAAIHYASLRRDTLCADAPGLGKTIVGVGLSNHLPEIKQVLIICPVHLKINWMREWQKWDVKGLTVGIAGSVVRRERVKEPDGTFSKNPLTGRAVYRSWTEKVWPDTQVVIINYDQLADFEGPIRGTWWDLLICDESHYLMTATSERTRNVLGGGKSIKKRKVGDKIVKQRRAPVAAIPAVRRLFLTGTPITGRPMNLWPICEAFDPNDLGKNWKTFAYRYCNGHEEAGRFDTTGASHLDELQVKARLSFMIRRDKALVMQSLPPLRRQLIELPAEGLVKLVDREVSAMRSVRDALAAFERDLRGEPEPEAIDWPGLAAALERRFGHLADLDYLERFKTLTPPEQIAFEELSTARKELAAAKIPMIVEHLNTWLDAGEKCICFVVHTELAEALRDKFPGCGFITGRIPAGRRQADVDRFQEDDSCRLMVANYVAGGTGYTMTASNIVVCAELEWSPYLIEQAEARAWRRGQRKSVLSQHLAVEGSSDARLVEVLLEKQTIVKDALDFDALSDSPLLFRA